MKGEDYPRDINVSEGMADFMRRMARGVDRRFNPVFDGHRTTYPGQQNYRWYQAVGLLSAWTMPRVVAVYAASELVKTPGRNVGIVESPQGTYHLGGVDEVWYPGKSIIDKLKP